MRDVLLAGILRALDVAVLEWQPPGVFNLVAVPPVWLRRVFENAQASQAPSLAGPLPLLDSFMPEAEEAWRAGGDAMAQSGLFTAAIGADELLLRARALTIDGRPVVILERLTGEADARPILQTAREHLLEHERLVKQVEIAHEPAADIEQGIGRLRASELAPGERRIVDALADASVRLRSALEGLPHAPANRGDAG